VESIVLNNFPISFTIFKLTFAIILVYYYDYLFYLFKHLLSFYTSKKINCVSAIIFHQRFMLRRFSIRTRDGLIEKPIGRMAFILRSSEQTNAKRILTNKNKTEMKIHCVPKG
jgi:hypothetical protein